MSESKIGQSLTRLFEKHRIVFWYDTKYELHADYATLDLPNGENRAGQQRIRRHCILRDQPPVTPGRGSSMHIHLAKSDCQTARY